MKFFRYFPLLALIAASAVSTRADAGDSINESATMSPNGRLVVSNVAGSVEIQGWKKKRVEVTGELGDKARLIFEIDGDTVRVEIKNESRSRGWGGNDTDLVIRVPRTVRVNATTVSADLDVRDIEGPQRLQTVSGDLSTRVYKEETTAKTVSGEIDIAGQRVASVLTAKSVSGDIDIVNVAGEIYAASVSGDIEGTAGDFTRLELETVSGDLDFRGNLEKGGRIAAESLSGDVLLELESLYDTEYYLITFSGDIRNILGVRADRQSRHGPGSKLEMTEGSGESRIEIETMSGDIDIVQTGKNDRRPDIQRTTSRQPDRDDGAGPCDATRAMCGNAIANAYGGQPLRPTPAT